MSEFFPGHESAASFPDSTEPNEKRGAKAFATLESRGGQSTKTRRGMAAAGEQPPIATTGRRLFGEDTEDGTRPLKRTCATIQQFARHTLGPETANGHTHTVSASVQLSAASPRRLFPLTTHWALLGSVREPRVAVRIKGENAIRVRYADGRFGSGRSSGTILVGQGTSSGTILVDYGMYFRERFS